MSCRQGTTVTYVEENYSIITLLQDGNIAFEIIYPIKKKSNGFRQTLMSHIPPILIFLHDKFPDIIVKSQAECNWQL